MPRASGPPGVLVATAGCPPCTELSLAALGERSAGLTGWAVVLPWQRIVRGMGHVVQRVAEGRAWSPHGVSASRRASQGTYGASGAAAVDCGPALPREAVRRKATM